MRYFQTFFAGLSVTLSLITTTTTTTTILLGLWIRAAKQAWDHKKDMGTARKLLQQALRINRTSAPLFLEYFRLECLYVHHLAERRQVRMFCFITDHLYRVFGQGLCVGIQA